MRGLELRVRVPWYRLMVDDTRLLEDITVTLVRRFLAHLAGGRMRWRVSRRYGELLGLVQQGGRVSDPGNGRLLRLLKAVVSGRVCALEPLGVLPLLGHARNFRWLTAGRQAIRMAALASHVDVLLLEDEGCTLVVAC